MPNKPSEVSVKVIYRGGYVWYNLTAAEFAEKFGSATLEDVQRRVDSYKAWKEGTGSEGYRKRNWTPVAISSPETSLPGRNWNDADGFSDSNGI